MTSDNNDSMNKFSLSLISVFFGAALVMIAFAASAGNKAGKLDKGNIEQSVDQSDADTSKANKKIRAKIKAERDRKEVKSTPEDRTFSVDVGVDYSDSAESRPLQGPDEVPRVRADDDFDVEGELVNVQAEDPPVKKNKRPSRLPASTPKSTK